MKKYAPPEGSTVAAYRFALEPTPCQDALLRSHCGAARKAWNHAKGRQMGFPKFRGRRAAVGSVRFTTGRFGLVKTDRRHVKLPRIGFVRTGESTRKLARRIDNGTARILSATVSFRAGRWFVAFQVQVNLADAAPARPTTKIGVNLGISHLAVSRAVVLAAKDRTAAPGSNHRVADLRRDGISKLTTALASQVGTIVVEDLNVAGMLRNRRLARHIADAGFGQIRRQLEYKTRWRGGHLVVADRWFASSKTCSDCGVVKAKLPLRVRTFQCDVCGLRLDRDINAARNLANLVEVGNVRSTASCVGTENMPAGNPDKARFMGMGTATGRPISVGQRRSREASTA